MSVMVKRHGMMYPMLVGAMELGCDEIHYDCIILTWIKYASNDQMLVWKYILYVGTRHCFACSMVAPCYIVDFNFQNGA